jgi:hypothetical protein
MAGEMFPDETDDDGFSMMALLFGNGHWSRVNGHWGSSVSGYRIGLNPPPFSSAIRSPVGYMLEQPECRRWKGEKADES